MELVTKRIYLFLSFFILSINIVAQTTVSLHDALIQISKQHRLSLIFNPNQIDNQNIDAPNKEWTIERQLEHTLESTNLHFKILDEQILIFKIHKIYGYLEDIETGERLIAATILSVKDGRYDVSNESGYFTLSTIEESLEIEVSYIGFATLKKTIQLDEMDKPLTLGLSYDNNVEEVVISDALISNDERQFIELNKGTDILLFQNQSSSTIGGEPDIFQAMVRQSGVNSGPDGIGGMHIRGGKNDQNQILYDGVRLYNSAHAFGVYSVINSNIIDQARLHKSGAAGSFSGRLSSIMDVRIKDPNLNSFGGNVQVSTIASQATLELPLIKDKLGVMLSGRRTHIDPIVKSLTRKSKQKNDDIGESNFSFDDVSLKLYGKINNNQRLYLNLYRATDKFSDYFYFDDIFDGVLLSSEEESSFIDWSNQLASLRYNLLLGSNTILNVQASAYAYNFKNDYYYDNFIGDDYYSNSQYSREIVEFDSGINSYDFKLDLQTNTNNHEFKYGLSIGKKTYQTGIRVEEELPDDIDDSIPLPEEFELVEYQFGTYNANEVTVHLTDKYRYSPSLLLESGLYVTHYESDYPSTNDLNSNYTNLFGYLKSLIKVSNSTHIGGSVGTFIQNEHLLTTGDNGYPSDIWLPSTELTPPARSYQAEIFSEINIGNHRLLSSLYYKEQKGLVVFQTPTLPSIANLDSYLWEDGETFLADAKGRGIEIDYSYYIKDKFTFRSVYTASFTDYYFEYTDGEIGQYPFDYSIPHTLNIAFSNKLTKRLRFSLDWYFSSGKPYTFFGTSKQFSPIERTESGALIYQISEIENDRKLPSAHKLSIAFSSSWHWGNLKNDLTLGIQNVYNRKNILFKYEYDDGYNTEQSQSSFPLMPLFKWRVEL